MNIKNDEKLSLRTVIAYGLAQGSGYQIMGALVGAYLLIFLTDTFGVPAGAVGVIMVIASIWDAINDPIMGNLADRTHTKWGKYRPYLLFVPIPLTFVVLALFSNPDLTDTGKIIWTAVFYILFGMLRTAFEIPCGGLINAITNKKKQRSRLISSYTMIMGIFTTITTSFALTMVSFFGGKNTSKGYMIVVGIASLLMIITSLFAFFNTKENFTINIKKKPFRTEIKQLFMVKGLVPVIASWLASYIGYNIMMASSVYYMLYYAARPDLISFYMLDISLIGLVGIAVLIPLGRKIFNDTAKSFQFSQIIVFICALITFWGGKNLTILFVFSGLVSLFATLSMAYSAILMTEMTDLVFLRSGNMMNGTMAALKGFSNKVGIALATGLIGAVLAYTGYIPGAIGHQNPQTLFGINFLRFIIPALMSLVIIISLKMYPITKEVKKEINSLYKSKKTEDEELCVEA